MIELKALLAGAVCKQFEQQDLVCPFSLRRGLFTVGALDNINHNPSATTAQGAFHSTAVPNCIKRWYPVVSSLLPLFYEKAATLDNPCVLGAGKADEQSAITAPNGKTQSVSWAAFHASVASDPLDPPVVSSLLPLFYEKAATLSMIKHGMDIQQQVTSHLNPGQIPITIFDQPLFALASAERKKNVVMFGGLHIEMATLGNLWIAQAGLQLYLRYSQCIPEGILSHQNPG